MLIVLRHCYDCPQIENEFGPQEWDQGAPAKAYTAWAAKMAVDLDTGIPWIMCKQDDAPDPVVSFLLFFLHSIIWILSIYSLS